MLGNAVVDYIVRECKENYGLDRAELIEENKKKKSLRLVFQQSDLKLSVDFQNDKIANIIYNSFLTDLQKENVTEKEYVERMSEMLEMKNIKSIAQVDEISRRIIKDINSGKLFGGNSERLLLNKEDREKLVKIKRFFGAEPQLLKLYEEIEELQTAYRNYRKTFYKDEQNLIEEIADCFVIALQINKVKMVKNIIKGLVDNTKIFKTEMIEKIIRMIKFKINRTVERIEKGQYGTYKIEYKSTRATQEAVSEEKEQQPINSPAKSFSVAESKKQSREEKEKTKKENKVFEFVKKNEPYYYQARDIQLNTKIQAKECTRIVEKFIDEGKITVTKKGKDGIYGATLATVQEAEVVE
nr:MAG TPA: triphosphate pyrophosphohydrolase [Caudoviricetes sp.]